MQVARDIACRQSGISVLELKEYGVAAKPQLPTLYKARKYYDENLGPGKPLPFPPNCRKKFLKGLDDGIKAIEDAKVIPKDLKSIKDIK